jgi:hypothetical protein
MAACVDRRRLLLSSAVLGAGALSSGCRRRSETCPPSSLDPADAKLREALHYTDHSPDPLKLCNGCTQYIQNTDADCGGCKIMKGLIHPAGYCAAFAAQT